MCRLHCTEMPWVRRTKLTIEVRKFFPVLAIFISWGLYIENYNVFPLLSIYIVPETIYVTHKPSKTLQWKKPRLAEVKEHVQSYS